MSTVTDELKQTKKLLWVVMAVVALAIVGLDQTTKYHAETTLMVWENEKVSSQYQGRRFPVASLGTYGEGTFVSFNFNYVRNPGAAWGMLGKLPEEYRIPFFHLVTIIAVTALSLYLRQTPWHHQTARYALVLILGGALGNYIDRMIHGYVIDFIDVRWRLLGWRYDFPNFNIADSAISIGVAFLIYDAVILERRRRLLEEGLSTASSSKPAPAEPKPAE